MSSNLTERATFLAIFSKNFQLHFHSRFEVFQLLQSSVGFYLFAARRRFTLRRSKSRIDRYDGVISPE